MSEIGYFQRYSQRENHATNNTLLMLRHLYDHSPALFEEVLKVLTDNADFAVGPRFEQQTGIGGQIPDGTIAQSSFKLFIEAKGAGVPADETQLESHLKAIQDQASVTLSNWQLVSLTSERSDLQDSDRLHRATFEDLLDAVEVACADERDLMPIVEDYRSFLGEEGLLPTIRWTMVAVPCGDTADENVSDRVYYHPSHRPNFSKTSRYFGIYRQKSIKHIAIINKAVDLVARDGKIECASGGEPSLSEDELSRIRQSIENGKKIYGDFARDPHRYYLFDQVESCGFEKSSRGGMLGHRYFDLREVTGNPVIEQLQLSEIAKSLAQNTWK